MIIEQSYYVENSVLTISKNLIGKVLISHIGGKLASGIICETEAYAGINDKASHAYGGRRTSRTETMYKLGGYSYVYLCYGIHHLFNIVTNKVNTPEAVLIRGIIPFQGKETIYNRRKNPKSKRHICIGPGKVGQALGINTIHDAVNICDQNSPIQVQDHGFLVDPSHIKIGPRIGIDYAKEDKDLPYRFWIDPKSPIYSELLNL